MKKQVMLTAVASLLTFASVAVLPAFAQDTGGQTYSPSQKRTEYSRHYGEHERYGKGERRDHDDYRYGKGGSKGSGGYGYSSYGKGGSKGSNGYGYSSYGRSGSGS